MVGTELLVYTLNVKYACALTSVLERIKLNNNFGNSDCSYQKFPLFIFHTRKM